MNSSLVLIVCAIAVTIAIVALAIAVIRTLAQVRATAAEAETFLRKTEPVVVELEATLREVRAITDKLSATAGHAERLAASFEGVGTKAARASHVVLGGLGGLGGIGGIGGPIGRAVALWSGVKAGLDVLSDFRTRRRDSQDGNRHHETQDSGRTYLPVGE